MTDIRVISQKEYGNKRWFKPTDFRFAAGDRVVAISFSEIPKAMMSLPLGFIKTELSYQLVVVQGLQNGQNLLVTPKGQWVADYIPAIYRSLPFRLAKNSGGEFVLCADHDTGLISETLAGYQFFEDESKLAPEAHAVAMQLMQFEADRPRTNLACKILSDHNVIEPWLLQIQQDDEIVTVDGLYRIHEANLNELPAEVLLELRACGGLMMSYAQLFSIQHLQQLGTVAQRSHWANKAAQIANKVAPLNIVDDNGILSFANL